MSIIVVANQKGGVGKTAISVNLAHGLMREEDGAVLVVDADPGASVFKWFRRREKGDPPYTYTGGAQPDIHRTLPRLVEAGGYAHCVVDCPAGASNITRSALMAADLVIVPVQPSLCDFDSAEELLPILREISEVRPELKVLVVISRKLPGSSAYSKEAREAAAQFFVTDGVDVHVAKSEIYNRIDILRAYTAGKTIFEYKKGSISSMEFTQLSEEVVLCLSPVAA